MPYGDAAGIQRFVDSVSDPASSQYRHFIPPDEVGRRFGISAANLKKVTDYFTQLGLPAPAFQAALTSTTEFVCGSLLLLGLCTRFAAVPLSRDQIVLETFTEI